LLQDQIPPSLRLSKLRILAAELSYYLELAFGQAALIMVALPTFAAHVPSS